MKGNNIRKQIKAVKNILKLYKEMKEEDEVLKEEERKLFIFSIRSIGFIPKYKKLQQLLEENLTKFDFEVLSKEDYNANFDYSIVRKLDKGIEITLPVENIGVALDIIKSIDKNSDIKIRVTEVGKAPLWIEDKYFIFIIAYHF